MRALGLQRATNGRGFVYLWIILYTFDLFLRLTTPLKLQLTCHSLTCLFRLLSQIGGRVLWEHQVAGSNPVAPTLKNQVILESFPNSLFLCLCLKLRKGHSRGHQMYVFSTYLCLLFLFFRYQYNLLFPFFSAPLFVSQTVI